MNLARRGLTNLERYISREIVDGCFFQIPADAPRLVGWGDWLLGSAVLCLTVYGVVRLRVHRAAIAAYLASTGGILLLWPEIWPGTGFLAPVVPLLLFCMLNGVSALLGRALARLHLKQRLSAPLLGLGLLVFIPDLRYSAALATHGVYPPNCANYFAMAEWAAANTSRDAVVACRKPGLFCLFANRRVAGYSFTVDDVALLRDLERGQVADEGSNVQLCCGGLPLSAAASPHSCGSAAWRSSSSGWEWVLAPDIQRPLADSGGMSGNGCAMDYENRHEYPALLVHVAVGAGLVDRAPRVIGFDDLVARKVLHASGSARSKDLGLFSFRLPHDEAPHGAVTHLGVEVREE